MANANNDREIRNCFGKKKTLASVSYKTNDKISLFVEGVAHFCLLPPLYYSFVAIYRSTSLFITFLRHVDFQTF